MGIRPVANPDLQGGASHPDPEIRGGGGELGISRSALRQGALVRGNCG